MSNLHLKAAAALASLFIAAVANAAEIAPEPISRVEPVYPQAARAACYQGRCPESKVIMEIDIERDGSVSDVDIVCVDRPGFGFAESAREAVRQWRYSQSDEKRDGAVMYVVIKPPPGSLGPEVTFLQSGSDGPPCKRGPRYPSAALKELLGGEVVVRANIAPDGHVISSKVESSTAPSGYGFEAEARKTVLDWHYIPSKVDRSNIRVVLTFRLQ